MTRRQSRSHSLKFGPALLATALGLALGFSGGARAADGPARTVVDELGREVLVPERINRIVSLAPNLTEIMYALGLGGKLVGVSNFCDYPAAVKGKTRVGPPMNPSVEAIIALRPDLVLGSTTANDIHTVRSLEEVRIPLYGVTDPHTVEEIFDSILRLAELTRTAGAGNTLVNQLRKDLAAVEDRVAGRRQPAALLAIWLEPLIAAGGDTFLHDVLRRAGAVSITAGLKGWPRLSLETVAERDPEVLIFTSAHGLAASFARLRRLPPWSELRAVREGNIIRLDQALFRPGPRIVEIIAKLAEELHPESERLGSTVR